MTDDVHLVGAAQRAIFEALKGSGDVSVHELFAAVKGPKNYVSATQRRRWLGSYLTRLNRRLRPHGLAVRPGDLKRTYRLNVV